MAPARRPVRLTAVALGLVLAGGLAACSDDGGGDDRADPTASHPLGSPLGAATTPSELCTAVLDDRDAEVFEAGRDASLDLLLQSFGDDEPGASDDADVDLEAAGEAMEALRAVYVADRERLAGAEVDAAEIDAWEDVLGLIDAEVETLDERIAFVAGDGQAAGLAPATGAPEEALAALDELGLTGRDCEVLASYPGPPAEHADFVAEAASACSAIVVRRRADTGFADDDQAIVGAVAAVLEGEQVEADPALVEALDRRIAEWEATRDDLEAVDADDALDPGAWEQVVGLAADRAEGYTERAEALDGGDQAAIAAAFEPGILGDPGFEGFEANGLGQRDCRSVQA